MSLNGTVKRVREKMIEIERRHASAREAYPAEAVVGQESIGTLDELRSLVVDFSQHQRRHAVLQDADAADLPEYIVWGPLRELLEKRYAGGLRGALRAASLGVDGGIRGIVENAYQFLRDEHLRLCRKFMMENEIPSVDWDAKVAVAREFLRGVACVVPKEQQIRAEQLAPRLEEIIEAHIERTGFSKKSSGR